MTPMRQRPVGARGRRARGGTSRGARRALRLVAGAGLLALASATTLAAQCAEGAVGRAGFGLFHCVGGVCWISSDPDDRYYDFSTEPRIRDVDANGRRAGLVEGQPLVSVDGIPITLPEGGRRIANLVPGDSVSLGVRGPAGVHNVRFRVAAACGLAGLAVTPDTSASLRVPRSRESLSPGPPAPPPAPSNEGRFRPERSGRLEGINVAERPGSFGFGVSCGSCGIVASADGRGGLLWRTHTPLEVTYVDPGGPADRAGLRVGDRVTHIDSVDVGTPEGSVRLSQIEAGGAYRLTIVRGGAIRTVTVRAR